MNRIISITGVFVATVGLVLTALPAQASSPSGPSHAEVHAPNALTVPSLGGAELQMHPQDASALATESGAVAWSSNGGRALVASSGGLPAALYGAVPNVPAGESVFAFDLSVADAPAVLTLDERGGVSVADVTGEMVNRLAPPSAASSTGVDIDARYEVQGDVLSIVTDAPAHAGDVTVRASYECNIGFCTSVMTRAETRAVANGDYAVAMAVIAVACGPAAGFCGIGFAYFVQQAKAAVSKGVCVGVRKTNVSAVAWPVHEPCRR